MQWSRVFASIESPTSRDARVNVVDAIGRRCMPGFTASYPSRRRTRTAQQLPCPVGLLAGYHATCVGVCLRKLEGGLCQNCVRSPPKPRSNSVIYADTPIHIVVAGSGCWELPCCVLTCFATRGRNRFPSVLLQPLGHLSLRLAQGRPFDSLRSLRAGGVSGVSSLARRSG